MFQSTPLCEGRRYVWRSPTIISVSFNPRPCVRGDAYAAELFGYRIGFNPRPCVRGDLDTDYDGNSINEFQSTPLCEGRHILCRLIIHTAKSFNPRPCVRGDTYCAG